VIEHDKRWYLFASVVVELDRNPMNYFFSMLNRRSDHGRRTMNPLVSDVRRARGRRIISQQ
jgi:hypothetical protein